MKKPNIAEVALTDEEDWGLFLLLLLPNSLQSLEDQLAVLQLGRRRTCRSAELQVLRKVCCFVSCW
jgi:hypothetical protein